MASDPNMGFHQDAILASALNCHAISFSSGSMNSSSGMISLGNSAGINSTTGMILAGNSSMINNSSMITPASNSSGALLLDSVPGLKHDVDLAVEWTPEEQSKLEEGLVRFADEPSIMRYIKIAATIPDKTVRDVALRCRWMTKKENGKRRKPEEHYMGKKIKDRKEKLAESSSKAILSQAPPLNVAAYSHVMPHIDYHDRISCEVPAAGGTTRHLLDENTNFFRQIAANLSSLKIQENIDLFCCTRNNIASILNDMRAMPGIMSQMPPLPVSINEELANSILPATQAMMFGSPGGINLKQEPGC
ncbi:PREDICTED: uncharacterized protein LOC104611811 isoform X2 [Nelumbo nucifera]|uniref:Uncharacterized protein LOC104611811 isoform X2 n=1 Tax=Nelumbo nucifera TaxID=4432 RepID=A0A1U8BC11_NELNU|nr:PREDICTED: uncharacterized protein LOC104611811 isoform X2 [Nelumbo nucifera]